MGQMDRETGEMIAGAGTLLGAFSIFWARFAGSSKKCPDPECHEQMKRNTARLDDGNARFLLVEGKMDKIAEDVAFIKGFFEAGRANGRRINDG